MKFKKLFLTFFLLIPGHQLSFAAQAPIAQESKNPLIWIGKGLLATAKGIGSGVQNAAGVTKDIWNATMTENRFWSLILGSAIGAYAWREVNFRKVIKPISDRYKENNGLLCTWHEKDSYVTHPQLRETPLFVLEHLRGTRAECVNGSDKQKAEALVKTINEERDMLEHDMHVLEEQFVTFFKTFAWMFESFGCKPWGIKRSYESICNTNAFNKGELQWAHAQYDSIDSAMKKECATQWWHVFPCFTGNYCNAAKVWWRLKKLQLRLQVIDRIIAPIAQGRASFGGGINYGSIDFKGNHWSTRHDHQPA